MADLYLRPFWKRIRSELLTQSTIHADETVMQVHKEKDRPDTSESRMWVYSSTKRADIQLYCLFRNLLQTLPFCAHDKNVKPALYVLVSVLLSRRLYFHQLALGYRI